MNDFYNPLKEYRQLMFWIETAGLLHDIGKLSRAFLEYRRTWQTQGGQDPHSQDFLGANGIPTDSVLRDEGFKEIQKLFSTTFDKLCELDADGTNKGITISMSQSIASLLALHDDPVELVKTLKPHISASDDIDLAKMLKAADSKDAEQDRNNALLVNEQDQTGDLFQSTVFGKEKPISGDLDQIRSDLYSALQEKLCRRAAGEIDDKLREEIHQTVLQAFQQTVSDTCRPVNDINLWEHCYATATLFKVLFAHFLLSGEKIVSFQEVRFALWGVGWDGLAYYGTGHKIRDITGRKQRIRRVKKAIRSIVEWEHCLGNTIYDDDNCLVFILPEIKAQEVEWFGGLKQHIQKVFRNEIRDECSLVFSTPKNTGLMVPVVAIIDEIRKKAAIPWQANGCSTEKLKWIDAWKGKAESVICPVCRKRPMGNLRSVCEGCETIRKENSDETAHPNSLQTIETIYHDEIAQGNGGDSGKLALIVARFDLERWLNGRYLYTQFVKDAVSLDIALEALRSKKITGDPVIVDTDDKRRCILKDEKISFTHKEIKELVERCKNSNPNDEQAKALLFLLDRHFIEWDRITLPPNWSGINTVISDLKEMGVAVSLENYLVTKNHSPSRLLRIWNTTRNFYMEQAEAFRKLCLHKDSRLCLTVDLSNPLPPCNNSILKGTIKPADTSRPEENIEAVYYKTGKFALISQPLSPETSWSQAVMKLKSEEFSRAEKTYTLTVTGIHHEDLVRARTITVSPDLFLAVVPAGKAMDCCGKINDAYQRDFGKVYGTLPMGLGVLFFNRQMPMFVVLDGARRMIDNFRALAKKPVSAVLEECGKDTRHRFLLKVGHGERKKRLDVKLTSDLGCGKKSDRFHPYVIVGKGVAGAPLAGRKSYFPTAAGDVLHFEDLQKGDEIRFHPNYFDFEYLDSTTRRFDLSLSANGLRKAGAFGLPTRPCFLEELEQSIERLWSLLKRQKKEGMTDTRLRNLFTLFIRWQSWKSEAAGNKVHGAFLHTAIQKEIKELEPDDADFFASLVESGTFFDVLELYLEILKERIEDSP